MRQTYFALVLATSLGLSAFGCARPPAPTTAAAAPRPPKEEVAPVAEAQPPAQAHPGTTARTVRNQINGTHSTPTDTHPK